MKYITPSNLEIDTVHGTVSANGVHLHISVSDVEGRVYGGHLKEGCIVRTTCELVVGALEDVVFDRVADEATGFDELVAQEIVPSVILTDRTQNGIDNSRRMTRDESAEH